MNGLLYGADGSVDVAIGARLQSLREHVVFVMANVRTGLPQEIQRLVQTSGMIRNFGHRRMILEILTIFDGSFFDLTDSCIDAMNSLDLIDGLIPVTGPMLDHPTGSTEIGKGMQVVWMTPESIWMTTESIYPSRIGLNGSKEAKCQYCADSEKTLDLHLHFHVHEILSFKLNADNLILILERREAQKIKMGLKKRVNQTLTSRFSMTIADAPPPPLQIPAAPYLALC